MPKDKAHEEFRRQMKEYCKQFKGQPGMEDAMKNMSLSDSSDDGGDDDTNNSHPQSMEHANEISSLSRTAVGVCNAATPSRAGIDPRRLAEKTHIAIERRVRPEQVSKLLEVAVPTCLVRQCEDLKSVELGRLQEGAVLKALEQRGSRLRFCKVHGEGPLEGWISTAVGGKQILRDVPETLGAASSQSKVAPSRSVHLDRSPETEAVQEPQKVVTMIEFCVSNASDTSCNGVYRYEGNFKGKPMYKNPTGAVIFFNGTWRMNNVFKVTSWLYSWDDNSAALPPDGVWRADGPLNGSASVECFGENHKVISEKGAHLKLENGSTIPKTLEHKTWRWCTKDACGRKCQPTRSQPKVEDACRFAVTNNRPQKDAVTVSESLDASSNSVSDEQARPTERNSTREERLEDIADDVPSLEDLLASIDAAERIAEEESAQADFFDLGRPTSSALMNMQAGLQGNITTGRGSQYTFSGLRDLGVSLAMPQTRQSDMHT